MNSILRSSRRPLLLLPLVLILLPQARPPAAAPGALPAPIEDVKLIASPVRAQVSNSPSLVSGPSGSVWLTWFEPRTPRGHRLMMSTYRAGRWSAPRTLAAGDSFYVNWAEIAAAHPLAGGHMMVTWPWRVGLDDISYGFRVASGTPAGPLGAPVRPHGDNSRTPHGFPSLIPEGDGALLVWIDGRYSVPKPDSVGDTELRATLLSHTGHPGAERVLDPRVCECCRTALVPVPGGALAAYRGRSRDEVRDIRIVRYEHGAWGEPRTLYDDHWQIRGCPVNGPAADARGEQVAIAWQTMSATGPRLRIAFSPDGGRTFAAPVLVDSLTSLGRPQVTLLEDGSALVLWQGERRRRTTANVTRVAPDGRLSATVTVGTMPQKAGGYPQMARTGNRLIIGWTDVQSTHTDAVKLFEVRIVAAR